MALIGGGTGPTLYMSIEARDKTGDAFERVHNKVDKLSSMAIRTGRQIGSLAMRFATLASVTGLLSTEQAKVIGIIGTVISTFTTLASVVRTLTAIDWAHVVALVWKYSLMTMGIGVVIAAAAAMAVLAMTTQQATEAQKGYNTELAKGVDVEQRRTANRSLVRRGLESELV